MARPRLALACAALLAAVLTGCGGDSAGAATWRAADPDSVMPGSTSVAVLVTRLGCNGGVTGRVGRPEVELGEAEVVVTMTVESVDVDAGCPSNDAVTATLRLPEPLRNRRLVDGGCRAADADRSCVRAGATR